MMKNNFGITDIRITFAFMGTGKRNPRSYKILDKHYIRAQKKAAKTEKSLAERIEEWVIEYGRPQKKINGMPLPEDFLNLKGISFVDPFGKTHQLK